ncbi:MAG: lipoyl(octanoyl) transferase [Gammaproteobacteria bacterium]|jgi:lipoyl(octanoyl) transferase
MPQLVFSSLGLVDYVPTWHAMQEYVDSRDEQSEDRIWLLEHHPVFTLGQKADPAHVIAAGEIPIVKIDRGGEVTYHGPGQLVVYPQILLERYKLGVRSLVSLLEDSVLELLQQHGVSGKADPEAPGVYIDGAKVASIGLRIRRGASYHGLSINVNMDMSAFLRINPCGYQDLKMTQLSDHIEGYSIEQANSDISAILLRKLKGN